VALGLAGVSAAALALRLAHVVSTTTVALALLLVVLFVASLGDLAAAIATSLAATLCFNFFFLPPVGAFAVADPNNWIALVAFLIVSVVASRLSASARAKAQEALDRGHELARLMDERRGAEMAQQRAELASALLASLSHDLRTPLTAIRTAISNLDEAELSEAQRREQARIAADELKRLARLFDGILDMARIESGTVQPSRAWTTPAEIVEAALAHDAPLLAGHDVRVEADDDRAVDVDPRLISSALSHVIENAVRYAGDGPIVVKAWADDEGLRLEVRDQGDGLQEGELRRLFEPFYRGERSRANMPGTGMGLAITRGFVAANGGRVWAENLSPRGACFSIAVPAATRVLVMD
jgi:two-component system sensor histidine kinase KdpD